jgi:hypothetical protein
VELLMRAREFMIEQQWLKPVVEPIAKKILPWIKKAGGSIANLSANAVSQGISNVERAGVKLLPLGNENKVVQISGRPIVVVDVDGIPIPFYVSTGRGGKASVASNQWYPFWGIGSDGWFNKGTEDMIRSQYNNPKLQNIANILNKNFKDVLNHVDELPNGNSSISVINGGKQPMSYKEAVSNLDAFWKRMENMARTL